LLSCLLGEMICVNNKSASINYGFVKGKVAYLPQIPFILNVYLFYFFVFCLI
jgi:hypothetical protein